MHHTNASLQVIFLKQVLMSKMDTHLARDTNLFNSVESRLGINSEVVRPLKTGHGAVRVERLKQPQDDHEEETQC